MLVPWRVFPIENGGFSSQSCEFTKGLLVLGWSSDRASTFPKAPPLSADLDDGLFGLLVGDGFEDSKTNLTHDGSMGLAFFTCIYHIYLHEWWFLMVKYGKCK